MKRTYPGYIKGATMAIPMSGYPGYITRPTMAIHMGDTPATTPAPAASPNLSDLISSPGAKTVATGVMLYHGYRRTGSIIWALLYGLAGREVPEFAVPIALAQGYGKRKICTTE
jgi:hypothetical protein